MVTAAKVEPKPVFAVLGALDNAALRKGAPGIKPTNGPGTWAAFIGLMWIIGYPAYFIGRGKTGMRSYAVPAIVTMLVFGCVFAFWQNAISEATADWQRKMSAFQH